MRNRAFTMVEVLVVIAIIMTLAALVFPVFQASKVESSKAACISNLKQMHLAIALYRDEMPTHADQGTPEEMGLPLFVEGPMQPVIGVASKSASLKCRGRSSNPNHSYPPYHMAFPPPGWGDSQHLRDWVEHTKEADGNPVIAIDPNHQLSYPATQLSLQRCLGVRLNGTVVSAKGRGDCTRLAWWSEIIK